MAILKMINGNIAHLKNIQFEALKQFDQRFLDEVEDYQRTVASGQSGCSSWTGVGCTTWGSFDSHQSDGSGCGGGDSGCSGCGDSGCSGCSGCGGCGGD